MMVHLGAALVGVSLAFPAAVRQAPAPNPSLPTLFVVGDSTANNNANGARGWGDPFAAYFDPAKVNVVNRARAGRSSRTFQTEGLWDAVLAGVKPGDVVLIQFGHNDAGAINDDSRARGSLPGIGEETQEIDNLLTKKHETVHTFGWYERKMIADTKAKGATPILLSLTVRNIWKDGTVERGSGKFGQWAAEVARAQRVEFIDLTTLIADRYEQMGEESVKPLFGPDHTHTSPAGAELNASLVVAGLKRLASCPVCQYFSARGQAVGTLPTLFLIGDSTVRNGQGDGAGGQWGWGEPLAAFFDATRIRVVNRALGGTSSRTYLTGGYWDNVLAALRPGDFVVMQFGHNDGGALNDDSRARGTIKGVGEETQEIDNLLTHQHEVVHTYGWYLRRFIADTRARGATPIVCSLVPRKTWIGDRIARNSADYAGWAAAVARAERVAFVDLNEIIAAQYDRLGPERVDPLFADPHTHTSWAGAELNAASVVAGLKALERNPLAPYFSARANAPASGQTPSAPAPQTPVATAPQTPAAPAPGAGQRQAGPPKPPTITDPEGHVVESEVQKFKVEVVARDLETPWGLAFLPDGRLLVTERPGRLRIIDKSGKVSEPVKGLPRVMQIQDGGLLDVEVHPQYARNGWIYLSYAEPSPSATSLTERAANNTAMTAIVRGKITKDNEWTDQQFIFHAAPEFYTVNHVHFGSRFLFDKQGHLFYTLGEHGKPDDAQDLSKPTGKVHRVNDDGSVPADNPFVGQAGAVPSIWTYGHRNPQGLSFDPATGKLWETEHGPNAGDELNLLVKGHNYGWAVVSNGRQPGITETERAGMDSPVVFWTPTLAPGGIAFYSGSKYPKWKNNLFITGLGGQVLRRLVIEHDQVTHQEVVFDNLGRIRDIIIGPDGYFYVATALPGARLADTTVGYVLRLVPAK